MGKPLANHSNHLRGKRVQTTPVTLYCSGVIGPRLKLTNSLEHVTSFISAQHLLGGRKSKCTNSECTTKHALPIHPNLFLKSDMQIQHGVLRHVSHRLVRYFCGEMQRKCQYNTRTRRGAKMDNNRNAPTSALIFSAPEGQYRNYRTRKGERIVASRLFPAPCLQSAANTPHIGFELSTPVYSEIGSGAVTQGTLTGILHTDYDELSLQTYRPNVQTAPI